MKYIGTLVLAILSMTATGQTEIELRTDGIVIPRLVTTSVSSPTVGQVIYDTQTAQLMYYNGTQWSSLNGVFERNGTTISQKKGYDRDDFIFGREDLPPDTPITDTLFFFDKSTGAFRGGGISNGIRWAQDSLGLYSFSYGFNTKATGDGGATALGQATTASGVLGATAMGNSTTASGEQGATALGQATTASGDFGATALGISTTASGGEGATALGWLTTASGNSGATALGAVTTASGFRGATAMGFVTEARGNEGAIAMGSNTIATGNSVTVVGTWNDTIVATGTPITETSPIFIVGNGDTGAGNRSNALTILKNGNIGIGTNTPGSQLHQTYNSTSNDAHIKLTEEGADGARIILENDQNDNLWTIYGRPYTTAASSRVNFHYNDVSGSGTETGNKFQIFGDGDATLEGTLTQNSDRRLKKKIIRLENALALIQSINGYSYQWKNDQINSIRQIGVIAQEVKEVLPEIVKTSEEGTLSVSYSSLVPVLIEGMKEQQEMIESVQGENARLKKDIEEIKALLKLQVAHN